MSEGCVAMQEVGLADKLGGRADVFFLFPVDGDLGLADLDPRLRPLGASHGTKYIQDIHPTDVYWCFADIGWITGHSYIVYAPWPWGRRA
jgi:hypothetical protein